MLYFWSKDHLMHICLAWRVLFYLRKKVGGDLEQPNYPECYLFWKINHFTYSSNIYGFTPLANCLTIYYFIIQWNYIFIVNLNLLFIFAELQKKNNEHMYNYFILEISVKMNWIIICHSCINRIFLIFSAFIPDIWTLLCI